MKLIYVTSNKGKVEEANRHFRDRYGFDIEIIDPSFEVLEIQATNCAAVAGFSAKYAADRLGMACLKSDTGVYIDCLGGLPGAYNAYFDKQIGAEKLVDLIKNEEIRTARMEHCFAYCEPNKEPVIFTGGSTGTIAKVCSGQRGRFHDKFYIPDGETQTLSVLREQDEVNEAKYWGTAIDDFALWYKENVLNSYDIK
jgi:XTP/dITP diphosphohydrolase